MKKLILLLSLVTFSLNAQKSNYSALISIATDKIESKVIEWRRDIHEHPELGNREVRTAALIAKHLKSLGIEVKTEVGITGVVGVLKGDKPGPVVALRADMDALPVEEKNELKLVMNFDEAMTRESLVLLPGKYRIEYRSKSARETIYSVEREFKIESGQTVQIKLF